MGEDGRRWRAKPKISHLHVVVVVAAWVPIHTERVSGGVADDDDDAPARGIPRRRAHPCRHPRPSPPHPPPGFDPAFVRNGFVFNGKTINGQTKTMANSRSHRHRCFFFCSLANALHIIIYLQNTFFSFIQILFRVTKILLFSKHSVERIIKYDDAVYRIVTILPMYLIRQYILDE